ncbi:MAG: hypothetical protein HQL53_08830 [Magnetococcales bacterium]|nr:hypothetical protein [Magnetococcales bacterium]
MPVYRLSDITPGMTLAQDVRDLSGRLLLAADSEITDKHLRIFRTWGISEADVLPQQSDSPLVAVELDNAGTESNLASGSDELKELFRHCDHNHPFIKELLQFAQLHEPLANGAPPKSAGNDGKVSL